MLETFTLATFQPLVGQTFRAVIGDAGITELTLTDASLTTGDSDSRRKRDPFRLGFLAPAGSPALQGVASVTHDTLGELSIFLVPLSSGPKGVEYEAIFS